MFSFMTIYFFSFSSKLMRLIVCEDIIFSRRESFELLINEYEGQ